MVIRSWLFHYCPDRSPGHINTHSVVPLAASLITRVAITALGVSSHRAMTSFKRKSLHGIDSALPKPHGTQRRPLYGIELTHRRQRETTLWDAVIVFTLARSSSDQSSGGCVHVVRGWDWRTLTIGTAALSLWRPGVKLKITVKSLYRVENEYVWNILCSVHLITCISEDANALLGQYCKKLIKGKTWMFSFFTFI